MYARKKAGRGWLWLLLLIIAVSVLIGSAVGKYRRSFTLEEATVTFTAKLAESVTLQEHKANRQPDGSYVLDENETVANMEYLLLPGLDVPKDPYVTITGKTPIDSYLFVEVVDETSNGAISYAMSDKWKALSLTGKHDGAVYVYTGGGSEPKVVDEAVGQVFVVFLLENNRITVGQKLLSAETDDTLEFYACLGETAFSTKTDPAEKAIDVYKKMNNMT